MNQKSTMLSRVLPVALGTMLIGAGTIHATNNRENDQSHQTQLSSSNEKNNQQTEADHQQQEQIEIQNRISKRRLELSKLGDTCLTAPIDYKFSNDCSVARSSLSVLQSYDESCNKFIQKCQSNPEIECKDQENNFKTITSKQSQIANAIIKAKKNIKQQCSLP